ncbi:hypothetical protein Salat_1087000 [Sesamum alatum]|uniref:Uncharacterized protein n=1 Tax=Sesamum alatum TaxID=300844 RepID=A0AAE2CSU7_9LAMI|nr:hypothetical protein Salat_1087000 [Sesamum alatum]
MGNKRRAPPQQKYFYKGKWTHRVDICFIDCFALMAERGHKQLSYSTQDLESSVVSAIQPSKTILTQPDFDWNPETNRMLVPKDAWDRVFRAALFPQRIMLEVGSSTAVLNEDAGPSCGVRSTSVGHCVEPGRSVKTNNILVDTSDVE